MPTSHAIDSRKLAYEQVYALVKDQAVLSLSAATQERIKKCRDYLDGKLQEENALFYGINTGFGSLCNIQISKDEIEKLQVKLVKSHACGMGEEVPREVVRLMLFLKIQSLSYGYSAASTALIERLIFFFNNDITPIIYQQGSLGASGDLAPLAHLSLPLIGLGEAYLGDEKIQGEDFQERFSLRPLALQSKEGLSLLNGTQFSAAYAVWCLFHGRRLQLVAELCAALSIDAFDCRMSPYDERLHRLRPHRGQILAADAIRDWLEGSQISQQEKTAVQDPYAFRCVPQVHGASADALDYIETAVTAEINAVTDNPNIFPNSDGILSGGNFHAQPLALPLDMLAIALAELGSISERRTYQLISGNRNLPPFLTPEPGLNSGLMIPQYTAASIVSQNKQLCTPASVDSIVSSNGQEDHVSMAANAATKAYRVVENVETILAIEFLTAAQALEFRRPLKSSEAIEKVIEDYRKVVPFKDEDRILHFDIVKTVEFLRTLEL